MFVVQPQPLDCRVETTQLPVMWRTYTSVHNPALALSAWTQETYSKIREVEYLNYFITYAKQDDDDDNVKYKNIPVLKHHSIILVWWSRYKTRHIFILGTMMISFTLQPDYTSEKEPLQPLYRRSVGLAADLGWTVIVIYKISHWNETQTCRSNKKGSENTEKNVFNKTVGFDELCISRCAHLLQIQIHFFS